MLMYLADTEHVVIACIAAGDFGRAQEGKGEAPASHLSVGIVQRHQQTIVVELVFGDPADAADGVGIEASHQRPGQLDTAARVVIAGDHHDVQLRQLFMGTHDEVVEPLLCFQGRVHRVEDVAGDE
jgi:hypothetical protein